GFDAVLGTRLEIDGDGRLTGRLDGPNCRGPEKVERLRAWLGGDGDVTVHAYGDSAGDRQLWEFADHAYRVRGNRLVVVVGGLGAREGAQEAGTAAAEAEEATPALGLALHRAGDAGHRDDVGHHLAEGVGVGQQPRVVAGDDLTLLADGVAQRVEGLLGDDAILLAPQHHDG